MGFNSTIKLIPGGVQRVSGKKERLSRKHKPKPNRPPSHLGDDVDDAVEEILRCLQGDVPVRGDLPDEVVRFEFAAVVPRLVAERPLRLPARENGGGGPGGMPGEGGREGGMPAEGRCRPR